MPIQFANFVVQSVKTTRPAITLALLFLVFEVPKPYQGLLGAFSVLGALAGFPFMRP